LKIIIFYQIFIILLCLATWVLKPLGVHPSWLVPYELAINCILTATIAGCLYCLRAVYLNKCVRKIWDEDWTIWYYLRPLTSAISGLASFIFLNAGLVILDASQSNNPENYGYLAFAFIAGLNVDKFVVKIEEIAKKTFNIEKSRTSASSENKEK